MIIINNNKNLCKVELQKISNIEIIKALVIYCKSNTDEIYSEVVKYLKEDEINFTSERDFEGNYIINC